METIVDFFDQLVSDFLSRPMFTQITIIVLLVNLLIAIFLYIYTLSLFDKQKKAKFFSNKSKDSYAKNLLSLLDLNRQLSDKEAFSFLGIKSTKLQTIQKIKLVISMAEIINKNSNLVTKPNYAVLMNIMGVENLLSENYKGIKREMRLKFHHSLFTLKLGKIGLMDKENLFKFLSYPLDSKLNEWDQRLIKQYYSVFEKEQLPDFGQWIEQTNETSQKICFIRLLSYFEQKTSTEVLLKLLKSTHYQIRKATIIAIGCLRNKALEQNLIAMYGFENFDLKTEIIKTLVFISSGNSLSFLIEKYSISKDLEERKVLLEGIYNYNEDGRLFFEKEQQQANRFDQQLFNHIKNPFLKSNFKVDEFNTMEPVNHHKNINLNYIFMNTS